MDFIEKYNIDADGISDGFLETFCKKYGRRMWLKFIEFLVDQCGVAGVTFLERNWPIYIRGHLVYSDRWSRSKIIKSFYKSKNITSCYVPAPSQLVHLYGNDMVEHCEKLIDEEDHLTIWRDPEERLKVLQRYVKQFAPNTLFNQKVWQWEFIQTNWLQHLCIEVIVDNNIDISIFPPIIQKRFQAPSESEIDEYMTEHFNLNK
eukprot:CAMPEP_0201544862 /NCGR_PEP_ID=MMETSP0173_2-20130828/1486_1 /ASSEMBLY_ACC=CAM_ASM_000268 /TAXON_ID=218659 /ORGANISM="Vexillifera sp., Strain DIVA3 564/2" /LENGTH=203 /DNA_ID=CAMNT_0047953135 /DNA_START=105 /DNA_END=713 /DNA_ORIENTATION=+